jgi:HSP20 family protein
MEPFRPLFELNQIQNEINRLFEHLAEMRASDDPANAWIPNVDVFETETDLVVKFELPGVDPRSLELAFSDTGLVLRGVKPRIEPRPAARFHCLERGFGPFKRVVRLGIPINSHKARAEFQDGLLRVTFPKVPNRRGDQVQIPVEVRS